MAQLHQNKGKGWKRGDTCPGNVGRQEQGGARLLVSRNGVRRQCEHTLSITRVVEHDDDGSRDFVSGVWACALDGEIKKIICLQKEKGGEV